MTDREKAIIMAYTGTAMLTGEKFSIFHKYIEDILGRSVWTHELADHYVMEEIKEKSKSDFLELCKNEETSEWIPVTYRPMTEEEEKELCEKLGIKEGSLEDWEKRVFTCHLPDDGQEILTSFFGKYVQEDICSWDEYGCGLENNGDWDGIDAWMPKPEPYKKEGESDADS